MTVRFSIVMPAYNAVAFYQRALSSVLSQTYPAYEILIIDDHSTDNTYDHIRVATAGDNRIRVLQTQQNGGPAVARNLGIAAATGDWIAVLDADDAYTTDRLATFASFITTADQWDIIADDLIYYDAVAGQPTMRTQEASGRAGGAIDLEAYLRHNVANGRGMDWGLLKPAFRKAFLAETGITYPANMRHGEDFAFIVNLLAAKGRFGLVDHAGYLYTQREGKISRRASGITRTTINYAALAASARALADTPALSGSTDLRGLALKRADGLMRLDDAHFFSQAIRRRDFIGIIRRSRQRPVFASRMIRQIIGAMWRRLIRS